MIYWKQRGTIKWVKFGERNTKFFHTYASIKHSKNAITSLQDSNGQFFFDHDSKADLFWKACKARLGCSEFNFINFDSNILLFTLQLWKQTNALAQSDVRFTLVPASLLLDSLPKQLGQVKTLDSKRVFLFV